MTAGETHRAIEATFRIERARLIAGLARIMRNVDLAEELAQDSLVVALSEWPRTGGRAFAALYDRLRVVAPSPVVDLNRAIAHSMAFGPETGLRLVNDIADADALRDYPHCRRRGATSCSGPVELVEARSDFKAAAMLTRNARERAFPLARADARDCQH